MTFGKVCQEPLRSRALIVAGGFVFAAMAFVRVWSWNRHDWWILAWRGSFVVLFTGIAIAAGVAVWRRRRRSAGFVVTRTGFGVQPAIPPGLIAALVIGTVIMQVDSAVDAWRVRESDPALVYTGYVIAGVMSLLAAAVVAAAVAITRMAWQGFAVELSPAGVRSRAGWQRRFIPWPALAPGGPLRPPGRAKRLHLVVQRPELVEQRGWGVMSGPRNYPVLWLDSHGWFLADAIRTYVEHPERRAAIGTSVERDRLVAELTAAAAFAAPPEPAPALTTALVAEAIQAPPVRPRLVRVAVVLVCVGVVLAVLAAVADLVITFVFRENLLAAERAVAEHVAPLLPPDGQGDGDVYYFTTDTVAFARGSAISGLIVTVLLGLLAIILVRFMARGSDGARIGLVVFSGIAFGLAMCPWAFPGTSLAAEPAAGALLNWWPAIRVLVGLTVSGLAAVTLLLLLNTKIVADRHS